jgi:hypothetical protein
LHRSKNLYVGRTFNTTKTEFIRITKSIRIRNAINMSIFRIGPERVKLKWQLYDDKIA